MGPHKRWFALPACGCLGQLKFGGGDEFFSRITKLSTANSEIEPKYNGESRSKIFAAVLIEFG